MKTSVEEFVSVLERMAEKLEELESRLSTLEQRTAAIESLASPRAAAVAMPHAALPALPSPGPGVTLATVGRVFLGIAGAYVLRALSESGVVPHLAVVTVALAYAFGWLVWAVVGRAQTTFARVAWAITAALILSPMLWELNTRFGLLPPAVTAVILTAFSILPAALAWKRDLPAIVGVATLAAALISLALLVATRDPAPFVLGLLVMTLAQELPACRERWLRLRPIAAVALDLAVAALILIYTRPDANPTEYKPIHASLLLALIAAPLAIYGVSVIFRTIVLQRKISVFEIGQAVATFVLAYMGLPRVNGAASPALGIFCLTGCAAFYLAILTRQSEHRNYHVFATWAAALFLAGSFLLLPEALRTTWLDLAALVAVWAGYRSSRMTLGFHGSIYLTAAALSSGLVSSAANLLIGSPPFVLSPVEWFTAATAIGGYAISTRIASRQDSWKQRLLRSAFAAQAAYLLPAFIIFSILGLSSIAHEISASLLEFIRTLAICLASLVLAFAGARRERIELVWLAYITIGFCTLKLLFQDLPHGSAGSIAASLFCYGMVWVLVPRATRKPTFV